MTALGIALTVTTAIFLMALLAGLNRAFVNSGNPMNVLVLRKGSEAELSGGFDASLFPTLKTLPGIAKDSHGEPMASGEWVVVIILPRKDGTGEVNVTVRGMMPDGLEMRQTPSVPGIHPRVKLVEGRWFQTGQREVVVSKSIRDRFTHANIGDTMEFGKGSWKVVGVFDAGGSAYESEVWGDVNQMASDFDRQGGYSLGVPARDRSHRRRRAQEPGQRRSTVETRRHARNRLLRQADQFWRAHQSHRHRGGIHHGDRLDFCRHEYDVCGGGVSRTRDCHAARDRFLAAFDSDLVCAGVFAVGACWVRSQEFC